MCFFTFDERMLFSSKDPSRRRVRARVLPREGNELERRWKRRRGPPKKRRAREDKEEINGSFVRKENIGLRKRYISFRSKKSPNANEGRDGSFRRERRGSSGRAVEWECRAGNKGSRRGVDDERVDASALLGRRRFQDKRNFEGLVVRSISRGV